MKELLLNQDPLNQSCLQALRDLKEQPESQYLYALQLASWAVENRKVDVGYQVGETLKIMYSWPPQYVMDYLEQVNPYDPEEKLTLEEPGQSPNDLAWAILDRIEDKLVLSIGYDKQKKA